MQFTTLLIVLSQRGGLLLNLRGEGVTTMPSTLFFRPREWSFITKGERPSFHPIMTPDYSPHPRSFEVVIPPTEAVQILYVSRSFHLPLTTGKAVIKFHNMVDITFFHRYITARKAAYTITGMRERTL